MKKFIKRILFIAFGTILGAGIIAGVSIGTLVVISKRAYQSKVPSRLSPNTVLRLSLHGQLVETITTPLLPVLDQEKPHELDMLVIRQAIQAAQHDTHIKGIYMDVEGLSGGWASLLELRNMLAAFKRTGKFIVAYGADYTSKSYYIAALADEIVLHPSGSFMFTGLQLTTLFYKGLLDKLDISAQIFRVGRYKSATEPFTRYSMSSASRDQYATLLQNTYSHLLQAISKARNITPTALQQWASRLSVIQPRKAYQANLFTKIGYASDAEQLVKTKLALPADGKVNYLDYQAYSSYVEKHIPEPSSSHEIAVLIAAGPIVEEEVVGMKHIAANAFVKKLKELREDASVKAVVIRIDSPGGSALASDTIWKEIMLTRKHKPVVASMGDVAASGGYYIAAGCDHILAQPTTITGSIGIFAMYLDTHAFLKGKLGIVGDVVKTNPSADLFNPTRPLTAHEKQVIQQSVDDGYDTFLSRVATGRNMKKEVVAGLGEGRVWPGNLAKKHGLVDELGGLDKAIRKAASLANVQSYQVDYWPKPRINWIRQLLRDLQYKSDLLNTALFFSYHHVLTSLEALAWRQGLQAWWPYVVEIE
jgi:protease-4